MEGPVAARVAGDERAQGVGHRLEERVGHAARRHRAQRVAVAAGVLGGDQAALAREVDPDGAPLAHQGLGDLGRAPRLGKAGGDLVGRQVADAAQQVVEAVRPPRPRPLRQPLEVGLDRGQRPGVDQVAQLLLAQQLAQQVAVERQRLGAPLGGGRVVLVHVRRHVLEQQRPGERRGGRRLDLHHGHLAGGDPRQQPAQRRQVEPVVEHLAVRLEDHREAAEAPRDLQQRRRLEALLPERRALPRAAARDEEGAGGVLAEARPEQGRPAELADEQLVQVLGRDEGDVGRRAPRRRRGGGRRCRRRPRSRAPPGRWRPAGGRPGPAPTARGRVRRRGSARRAASRRSRRGSARRRSRGRSAPRPWPRPGPRGSRPGCPPPGPRRRSRPAGAPPPGRARPPPARAPAAPPPRRARRGAPPPRPSRTAGPRTPPGRA